MLTFLKITTVLVALMLGRPTHAGQALDALLTAVPLGQYSGSNQLGDCTVMVEMVGDGVRISLIELTAKETKIQIFPFESSDETRVSAAEFGSKSAYLEYTSQPTDRTSAAYVRTLNLSEAILTITEKRKALFSNTKTAECELKAIPSN